MSSRRDFPRTRLHAGPVASALGGASITCVGLTSDGADRVSSAAAACAGETIHIIPLHTAGAHRRG